MSKGTKLIRNSAAEFLIFTGQAGIESRHEDETVWLTQILMAKLFAAHVDAKRARHCADRLR